MKHDLLNMVNKIEPYNSWLLNILKLLKENNLSIKQYMLLLDFYIRWKALESNQVIKEDHLKWTMLGWFIYKSIEGEGLQVD